MMILTMPVKLKVNTIVVLVILHFMSSRKNIVLKKQILMTKMMKRKLIELKKTIWFYIYGILWCTQLALLSGCLVCNLSENMCKIRQQGVMTVNLKCAKNHISNYYSLSTIKGMVEGYLTKSVTVIYSQNTFERI